MFASSSAVRASASSRVVACGACSSFRSGDSRSSNARSSSSGRAAVGPKLLRGKNIVVVSDDTCRRRSDSHVASAAAEATAYGAPPATNPEAYIVLVSLWSWGMRVSVETREKEDANGPQPPPPPPPRFNAFVFFVLFDNLARASCSPNN